jgi:hypothetical protein
MLGVVTAGFRVMLFGVTGMSVSAVRMVCRFFVIASFVMLGGFAMMLRRVLVMFGSLVMMLYACVIAHVCSPGFVSRNSGMIRLAI